MNETKILRVLLVFTAILVLAWFFWAIRAVLLPVFMAGLLAFILNPVVSFMELRGVRRRSGVTALYGVFLLILIPLVYWGVVAFWQDLPRLRYQLPSYVDQALAMVDKFQSVLSEKWPWLKEKKIFDQLIKYGMTYSQETLRSTAPHYLTMLFNFVLYIVLVPFMAFYLLREGRGFFQKILDACPGRWVEKFLSLLFEIDEVLGNYLRGLLLDAILIGILVTVGLLFIGVDNAALVGVVSAMANVIPYMGAFLGCCLGAGMAFFQYQNLAAPMQVLMLFIVVRFMDDWVIQPFIMKRSVDLHPVVVILTLMAGGHLAGVWGLMLAVPIASIVHQLAKIFSVWYLSHYRAPTFAKDIWSAAEKPWVV